MVKKKKSNLFFLIAVPVDNPNLHIDVLAKLAGLIEDEGRINNILNADNFEEVLKNIHEEEKEVSVEKNMDM